MVIDKLVMNLKLMYFEGKRNLNKYKIIILMIILYLLTFQLIDPHGPNCLIKRTIGIPCPGCGMTRASYYLLTLQFEKAAFYHPLVFIMPIIFSILLFNGYGVFNTLFKSKVFWGIIVTLFIGVYIYRMYMYYPSVEPMDHFFTTN
ncbi:hypothetical protein KQ51_00100 [Candidatus Izimaplasma bacterium HR1]|jgi:Na+/H+ antiporter NhaC|uniref:DUF2752 domain-containing protein n=1 Tax=Candidatus Izimoplasma sp. HR1 TaxID=1541959 RepID=UPI0004F8530B|nr:hypothetical protein KQ51_00100 [Candidatus Izimaplasma bacterium HR1]